MNKETKKWVPEIGEEYFFITDSGMIKRTSNDCALIDYKNIAMGNVFQTKEEAENALKLLKIYISRCLNYDGTSTVNDDAKIKLTEDIFNHPECPEWANYAVINSVGEVYVFAQKPYRYAKNWSDKKAGKRKKMPMLCDNSDWQNIRIKRPVNLPVSCKVGEWVWTTTFNAYFKVDRADKLFIDGKGLDGSEYSITIENLRQARLRPYNKKEMRGLVGKVIDWESNRELVISYNAAEVEVYVDRMWCNAEYLMNNEYTIDGKPCGVLEHLNDNGEWVQ